MTTYLQTTPLFKVSRNLDKTSRIQECVQQVLAMVTQR